MQKIVNILKMLVIPKDMAKARRMSVLIALFIFILSSYLLAFPYGVQAAKSTSVYKTDYNFMALQEIPDEAAYNAIFTEIDALECAVGEENELVCSGMTEGTVYENLIEYESTVGETEIPVTRKIHFYVDNQAEGADPAFDVTTDFDDSSFPYETQVEHYFVLITPSYLYYQAQTRGIDDLEMTHNDQELSVISTTLYYDGYIPDFNLSVDTPETYGYLMGTYIVDQILVGLAAYAKSSAFINTLLICVFFPLLMVLIFWLFFKRNGKLVTFREYFNIASLTSIIPLIITFGVSWLYPAILNAYIFIFSIFYLFVLYKINNSPDQLD